MKSVEVSSQQGTHSLRPSDSRRWVRLTAPPQAAQGRQPQLRILGGESLQQLGFDCRPLRRIVEHGQVGDGLEQHRALRGRRAGGQPNQQSLDEDK